MKKEDPNKGWQNVTDSLSAKLTVHSADQIL